MSDKKYKNCAIDLRKKRWTSCLCNTGIYLWPFSEAVRNFLFWLRYQHILIQKVNPTQNHLISHENPPAKKIYKTWPFRDSHPTAYLSSFRSTFCKVLLGIFSSSARRYLFFAWLSSTSLVIFIFSFKDKAFWNFAIFSVTYWKRNKYDSYFRFL